MQNTHTPTHTHTFTRKLDSLVPHKTFAYFLANEGDSSDNQTRQMDGGESSKVISKQQSSRAVATAAATAAAAAATTAATG